MKTRNFWLGVAAGALAVGAVWYWMAGSYPAKHQHVWSRWGRSEQCLMKGSMMPMNERHCKRCGFRETVWALSIATPAEE